MFKSFFNNKEKTSTQNIGLEKNQPILMNSIESIYAYLKCLCSIQEGLSYERIGTIVGDGYPNLIDKYTFTFHGETLCDLFIYAYHDKDVPLIPTPFKELNSSVDESIFENMNEPSIKKNDNDKLNKQQYLKIIIDFTLLKNNCYSDNDVSWTSEKQDTLNKLLQDLKYEDNLEELILGEFQININQNSSLNKEDFIETFSSQFHHKKLSKLTPDYIKERNQKLETAYHSIIQTIHKIQAWQDSVPIRMRIESDIPYDHENFSKINQCITPFCAIFLECDTLGRFFISYGIEAEILRMIPNMFANTLIRRIYQFTQGELEDFVHLVGLHMNCIALFEEFVEKSKNNNHHQLIEVKRHEEESISDILSKLKLNDDVDEETKKWLNR